jgi:hypothetical protein
MPEFLGVTGGAMTRSTRSWLAVVVGVFAVLAVSGFGARASSASGGWAKALTITGPTSYIGLISCSSPGNCAATGGFVGSVGKNSYSKLFVISQVKGTWGKPILVPGTARTSSPSAGAGGIACVSSGNCVLVGTYTDGAGRSEAFIISEVHGTWRKLIWVDGLTGLGKTANPGFSYLSCPSAGNCTAFGTYNNASGTAIPFTVTEVKGIWGTATPVPGLSGLPGQEAGSTPEFGPISCPSPGNCSAGGYYGADGGSQAYVDDEVHGVWGAPEPVAGLAALNTGAQAGISAISCSSPGNCGTGGTYIEEDGASDSFVVSEINGAWGTATEVKSGIPGFNADDGDYFSSISCPSAGNCTAGGTDNVEHDALASAIYVVSEVHGKWGKAISLPGTSQLNQGDQGQFNQVSCSSPGNCGVAGVYSATYDYGFIYTQPFVATEVHGTWIKAVSVPGIKVENINVGQEASTTAISCTAPGRCSAGGWNGRNGFVDSQP